MSIEVELAGSPNDEIRALVKALEVELAAGYLPEQQHGLKLEAIFQPHIKFFVARLEGKAVGCGGVAFFEGFAEAKRMFVAPQARGRGAAQAILARLEQETRAAGLAWLRLETGDKQVAAMRLYEAAGFRRCGAFGDYLAMTPQAIATSVFYEKHLEQ